MIQAQEMKFLKFLSCKAIEVLITLFLNYYVFHSITTLLACLIAGYRSYYINYNTYTRYSTHGYTCDCLNFRVI